MLFVPENASAQLADDASQCEHVGEGALRVELGTYLQAFMLSGLLCLIAVLMVLFIGRSRGSRMVPVPVPAQ